MTNSLLDPRIATTLDRLFAEAPTNDAPILAKVRERFEATGVRFDRAVSDLLSTAFIPVARDVGALLYSLVRARGARTVVEFGTSYGLSTIHLAAAVRDNGGGMVITSELDAAKVKRARENLDAAGVLDVVEIREGDARETLSALPSTVDVLFLDGWKDLYLPVFERVRPRLHAGALIIADDVNLLPEAMAPYLQRVRTSADLVSTYLPHDDGLEITVVC